MGLNALLARLAATQLHVLVVEASSAFSTRASAESAVLQRGWRLAESPAEADALLVCGGAADDPLATSIEAIWEQLPGPRARAQAEGRADVGTALDLLAAQYLDGDRQRSDAADRTGLVTASEDHSEMDHSTMDHSTMGHGEMGHGEMGHGEMGHGEMGHGEMGHMDMSGPGGIALASGERDRDGLEMDVLHVRLGPGLAHWPAGLVIWCSLQGDTVTGIEVEAAEDASLVAWSPSARIAFRLDAAARLLALAGAGRSSERVRGLRDQLLADVPVERVLAELATVRRGVLRSRALRWSLRALGDIAETLAAEQRWPSSWHGDVHARLARLLEPSIPADTPVERSDREGAGHDVMAAALPQLVAGQDLAAARLIVASLIGHHSLIGHDSG